MKIYNITLLIRKCGSHEVPIAASALFLYCCLRLLYLIFLLLLFLLFVQENKKVREHFFTFAETKQRLI